MMKLELVGRTLADLVRLDRGISDLLVRDGVLYTLSGPTGGLAAYGLGAGGGPSLLDFAYFPADLAPGVLDSLTLMDLPGGPFLLVAEAPQAGRLAAYALETGGGIGAQVTITGIGAANGDVLGLGPGVGAATGAMLFVGNEGQTSIQGYGLSAGPQISAQITLGAAASGYADSVFAMETVTVAGVDFLLAASLTGRGVSAYRITPEGLVTTGNLGVAEGVGIMTPSALASIEIAGRCFVLLGSAPADGVGQSGAITVMELRADGSLVLVDHVLDTQATRFGMIQSLEVITSNGVTYVMAAGGDDGMTLFALLPHGRLVMLDQMTGAAAAGLMNVTALAALEGSAGLRVFAASELGAGVTEFSIATGDNGLVAMAQAQGGTLLGTAQDDILIGGAGDDSLAGGNGADILEDGDGRDTLSGGGGRDIFVLRADGQVDTIVSFERGTDRLDLSDWPFFYDPAGLSIQSTPLGAIVTWRNETLVIETMNRRSLSAQDVRAAVLPGPDRRPFLVEADPDSDRYLVGTAGADVLEGAGGQDTLFGEGGDDVLLGGAGWDVLYGGTGNDRLEGGLGFDRLYGGSGNDLLLGGALGDQLWGDAGNDTLDGGSGNDVLRGGSGNDSLLGGVGNDALRGESGADTLLGDAGDDRLWGGSGNDRLWGGDGNDMLDGQLGRDSLYGDGGDDTLFGRAGFDLLRGGDGNDLLYGGPQGDRLYGDAGDDTLEGGDGNDRLWGGSENDLILGDGGNDMLWGDLGNDTLLGGDGDDQLFGGGGFDRIEGGAGNDRLWGNFNADTFVFADGHGRDTIEDFEANNRFERIDLSGITALSGTSYGALLAAGAVRAEAGGVLIDTGGGNSIWLVGVALADLDNRDFIF
jgi:Ca2+-binding RTX toxin-like protein